MLVKASESKFKDFVNKLKHVVSKCNLNLIQCLYAPVVTLTVFPGFCSSFTLSFISDQATFTVFLVLIVNVSDTIGRYIGGLEKL